MSRRKSTHALEFIVPVVVVLLWWQLSKGSKNFFFPPLSEILFAFKANWLFDRLVADVAPSLTRLCAGFGIAVVIGIGSGMVLGLSGTARHLAGPLIEFMRAIPAPAMIPFGIIVLGVGDAMKIAVIALVCLWPILLSTIDGIRAVEPLVLDTARVYRLRLRDLLFRIVVPSASPQIFAGVRTSISLALVVMVISEMVASTNGIGYFVLQSQRTFAMADMFSGVLLLGLLGYGLNLVVNLLELVLLRWHRGARRTE